MESQGTHFDGAVRLEDRRPSNLTRSPVTERLLPNGSTFQVHNGQHARRGNPDFSVCSYADRKVEI
jgi:hypothetical protein